MTTTDIQQAKEWAESRASGNYLLSEGTKEAVKVIQSLPDTVVDGDKLWEVVNKALANTIYGTVGRQIAEDYAALIGELIPAPSLPTLAELIEAGNDPAKFQWMQCRIGDTSLMGVITGYDEVGEFEYCTSVTFRDEADDWFDPSLVTPVPGPKLEWPGSHADTITAESVEDTPAVDDEPVMLPRPEDVKPGDPWLVKCGGHEWVGTRDSRVEIVCSWAVARLDGADFSVARDDEITLISRMVPEAKP